MFVRLRVVKSLFIIFEGALPKYIAYIKIPSISNYSATKNNYSPEWHWFLSRKNSILHLKFEWCLLIWADFQLIKDG